MNLHRKIKIGEWNVRSLSAGKLKIICDEMDENEIDILGISEIKWKGKGSFTTDGGKKILFCGSEAEGRCHHGVGVIISKKISQCLLGYKPVNDRVLYMRVKAHPANISIVQFYAPTSDANEEAMNMFYEALQNTLDEIAERDVLIVMGDANAKVGEHVTQTETVGQYGLGMTNERGEKFIEFCRTNDLAIMNTMFKKHPRRLYTWTSPDMKTKNQIDFITIRKRWKKSISNACTYPGAECGSDHNLLIADFKARFQRIPKAMPPIRYDFDDLDGARRYSVEVRNKFANILLVEEDKTPNELWEQTKQTITTAAKNNIARKKNKRVHWISDETLKLINDRKRLKKNGVETEHQIYLYKDLCRRIQKSLRSDKRTNIDKQCDSINQFGHLNASRDFFRAVKNLTNKFHPRTDTVKDKEGNVKFESEDVKQRWKEYCSELYSDNTGYNYELPIDGSKEDTPTLDEVKSAISQLKNNKSPGGDEIPSELLKLGGEETASVMLQVCRKIWNEEYWPADYVKSIFVVIPKKGDIDQCSNNRTIALISHASKIMLKIIANRMKAKLDSEISIEQAGFRPGRGTRDQIFNLKMLIEKYREFNRPLYMTFIDYRKAFDSVNHNRLWKIMYDMGFSTHLIRLIKNLYETQKACVRTTHGCSESFTVTKGVRQGCILSPALFNIYTELIMRKALNDFNGNVKVVRQNGTTNISNLRYADDVVLLAESLEELQTLLDKVRIVSEEFGLMLHSGKTKAMKIIKNAENIDEKLYVNSDEIEFVNSFVYLGCNINSRYDDSVEINRRIAIAKSACRSLTTIWKDKSIGLRLKLKLLRSLVFPIATYGAECWSLKLSDKKRIQSFETWCYRRMMRVSWMEKLPNEWVMDMVGRDWSLLGFVNTIKLKYFGHITRKVGLENDLMYGTVEGKRGRGRCKTRWSDGVRQLVGESFGRCREIANDREQWKKIIKERAPVRTDDQCA